METDPLGAAFSISRQPCRSVQQSCRLADHGPEGLAEQKRSKLARIVTGSDDGETRCRWTGESLAHDVDESRVLGFPLDWPDWSRAREDRAEVPCRGRDPRVQTVESLSERPMVVRVGTSLKGAAATRRVVTEWSSGAPWWHRYRSESTKAELVGWRRAGE